MSLLCANSGDYRNPTLDEQFDKALESVRKMCVEYAAHQTKHLTDMSIKLSLECATLRAERDALKDWLFGCKKERDALTVELGQARADAAKLRGALQKLLPWCDKVPESVFDHAKDVLACTQDPPIFDATHKP